MRIIIVHPRMSVMGGGERVAIHSIKEALREGHEVYLATEEFDVPAFEDFFGVQDLFRNVRLRTYPPFRPLFDRAVLYQRLLYQQQRLRKIVSTGRGYDLLLNTAEVANQPGTRLPSAQYCYFPEYFSHLESNAFPKLWDLYYLPARAFYHSRVSHINRLLAVSDFTRQIVKKNWGRESIVLYPPCPIDLYSDLSPRKEDLVITVGRMAPEKRMELFLEVARRLQDIKFAIIGSVAPGKESYYKKLKAAAPNNVSFLVSPLRKAKDILGRAKIYFHSAFNEHFGITIVEAMAAGCVPIVHNSGGPREIVTENVGFKWDEVGEAVRLVSDLIESDEQRKDLSKAAKVRAKQFGPDVFESGLAKVLREFAK